MGNPVVHFEINGRNAAALQRFYGELFDWEIHADNPMNYGTVHTNSDTGIGGGIGQTEHGPQTIFYIRVDDPQPYLDRITAAGGKVVLPVTEIPGGVTFAQFADPEGNVVGIVKE